jgi:hypothetical protein
MRVPSYGLRKHQISADSQYTSTGWLISGPMTLKFWEKVGLKYIHRSLLAFSSPVPGFCAMVFTLIFDELGHSMKTKHWPCLSFGKRVDIGKIEMLANF